MSTATYTTHAEALLDIYAKLCAMPVDQLEKAVDAACEKMGESKEEDRDLDAFTIWTAWHFGNDLPEETHKRAIAEKWSMKQCMEMVDFDRSFPKKPKKPWWKRKHK